MPYALGEPCQIPTLPVAHEPVGRKAFHFFEKPRKLLRSTYRIMTKANRTKNVADTLLSASTSSIRGVILQCGPSSRVRTILFKFLPSINYVSTRLRPMA
jgi:hypothetical protein